MFCCLCFFAFSVLLANRSALRVRRSNPYIYLSLLLQGARGGERQRRRRRRLWWLWLVCQSFLPVYACMCVVSVYSMSVTRYLASAIHFSGAAVYFRAVERLLALNILLVPLIWDLQASPATLFGVLRNILTVLSWKVVSFQCLDPLWQQNFGLVKGMAYPGRARLLPQSILSWTPCPALCRAPTLRPCPSPSALAVLSPRRLTLPTRLITVINDRLYSLLCVFHRCYSTRSLNSSLLYAIGCCLTEVRVILSIYLVHCGN